VGLLLVGLMVIVGLAVSVGDHWTAFVYDT